MMPAKPQTGALDRFRVAAALLIVAIHISPLASCTALGDFVLTRILARVAVPFFLMLTGYFVLPRCLDADRPRGNAAWQRQSKKLLALYAGAALLYLPLSLYAGYFTRQGNALWGVFKPILFDGTYYHLWYLPAALLGLALAVLLARGLGLGGALALAGALYLVGLFGDSYYGLIAGAAPIRRLYGALFAVSSYTRNGVFYAPLFLCLGGWLAAKRPALPHAGAGLLLTGLGLLGEGLALHRLGWQRHDSMYLLLPFCMVFLFALLVKRGGGARPALRGFSLWVYILHPMALVFLRGGAGVLGLTGLLIDNSVVCYLAVCALSCAAAGLLTALQGMTKRPDPTGRAWIELDRAALAQNAALLKARLPRGCALMPAVKADAYGHGAVLIARELYRLGVRHFCVACLSEGIALRRAGVRGDILVLGRTDPSDFALLRRWRITQTVVDGGYARQLNAAGGRIRVHLGVDTGMHRLGVSCGDTDEILRIFSYNTLNIRGVFTHLCADDSETPADIAFSQQQIRSFFELVEKLDRQGVLGQGKKRPLLHLQGSYGILRHAGLPCTLARPGIALYGMLSTAADTAAFGAGLRPVLSLKARVAAVKTLAAGESAGYGLAFTATRPTILAVLAIGYADGLPRALSCGTGQVLVRGRRAPMVGRLCMDQLLADVTGIPGAAPGDIAILIGRDGGAELTACEVAAQCGTITNELLSRLGARLARAWKA